jgi:hypothetical protein
MHLLIPTQNQIRAVYAATQTDILNAHRRCAPQAELNALHDKQVDHQMAINLIECAKSYRHKARALLVQSDSPGYSGERDGLRCEAQRQHDLAEQNLHRAYALLGIAPDALAGTGSDAQDESNRKWNEAAARENLPTQ